MTRLYSFISPFLYNKFIIICLREICFHKFFYIVILYYRNFQKHPIKKKVKIPLIFRLKSELWLLILFYYLRLITTLLLGSSPILTVFTVFESCKAECIIFLSYACIGSNVTVLLVLSTDLATFFANSWSVFSLFSF